MDFNKDGRALVVEMIGTFALVFIGAGAGTLGDSGLVGVALAHGLVLLGMIYATGHISGTHINPAVTLAVLAARRITPALAVGYIVAQLFGAILAAGVLRAMLPAAPTLGNTLLNPAINVGSGLLLEALLTFFLVFVIFGGAVDSRSPTGFAGIGIGLTLAACILMGGPLTGASLNPARSLGPAIVTGNFSNIAIYIVGPILGALAASLLWSTFLLSPAQPASPADEVTRTAPKRKRG